jgi:hypothetical protein
MVWNGNVPRGDLRNVTVVTLRRIFLESTVSFPEIPFQRKCLCAFLKICFQRKWVSTTASTRPIADAARHPAGTVHAIKQP